MIWVLVGLYMGLATPFRQESSEILVLLGFFRNSTCPKRLCITSILPDKKILLSVRRQEFFY